MTFKKIDQDFFKNYAGSKRSYNSVFRDYSYIEEGIDLFLADDAPPIKSVCVLGTGTGASLKFIKKAFDLLPYGCEISPWAYAKTPKVFQKRVVCSDMIPFIEARRKRGQVFDLSFSNSLIYLDPKALMSFLRSLAFTTRYLHFRSSFTGEACPDSYRRILKSYSWWNRTLKRAGFEELRTTFGQPAYLWKSRRVR